MARFYLVGFPPPIYFSLLLLLFERRDGLLGVVQDFFSLFSFAKRGFVIFRCTRLKGKDGNSKERKHSESSGSRPWKNRNDETEHFSMFTLLE